MSGELSCGCAVCSNEIAKLQTDLAEARRLIALKDEALRPFAAFGDQYPNGIGHVLREFFTLDQCRAAAADRGDSAGERGVPERCVGALLPARAEGAGEEGWRWHLDHKLMTRIAWIPLRLAQRFIRLHHRHRPTLHGAIVALGLTVDGELRGVAVIGRAARMDRPDTAVITRLCTDGCRNGCSRLYAKAKRLAQALGFVGIKTFTRLDESGSSLFAVGAKQNGQTKAEHWSRHERPRSTEDAERKTRWEL